MVETVTLKIPLIIDSEGNWSAQGSVGEDKPDWSFMDETVWFAAGETDNQTARHFVEVEVPIPVVKSLEGSVAAERDGGAPEPFVDRVFVGDG